jgi:hypothetical protein
MGKEAHGLQKNWIRQVRKRRGQVWYRKDCPKYMLVVHSLFLLGDNPEL